MGYLYCKHCNKFYEEKTIKNETCPDINCQRELVEIDENMIVPIYILNSKGYTTTFCCSGHIKKYYFGGYISFKSGTKLPENPPKGWHYDDKPLNTGDVCIRYNYKKNMTNSDKAKMIFARNTALINWCEELPNVEEG